MTSFPSGRRVSVVVPIFDAYPHVVECLDALMEHTDPRHRIVLLDDGSRDRRIWGAVSRQARKRSTILALRNSRNLGFSTTVNLGCRMVAPDDVILLNSDTRVTPGWLDRLAEVAEEDPSVGTVTPLSNQAGPFSIPTGHRRNRLPDGITDHVMARLVEECSSQLLPESPTGHGFCLMVTRRALNDVGEFDERTFPDGCGAENDFCVRASRRGYRHLIHDSVFVYHHGRASFGLLKYLYLYRSARRMRRLHPDYGSRVAEWIASDPLGRQKAAVQQRLQQLVPATALSS